MLQTVQIQESCLYQNRLNNSMVTCSKCFHRGPIPGAFESSEPLREWFAQEYAMDVLQGTKIASATDTLQIRQNLAKNGRQQELKKFSNQFFLSRIYEMCSAVLHLFHK